MSKVPVRYDASCPAGRAFLIDPAQIKMKGPGGDGWQPYDGDEPFLLMNPADSGREAEIVARLEAR